jgi:uncharacterized UBP type Zn finger protein
VVRLITGVCKLVYPRVLAIAGLLAMLYAGQFLSPVMAVAVALLLLSAELWIEASFTGEGEAAEAAPHLVPCEHADEATVFEARVAGGCEECRRNNYKWVHLRLCLSCGHVGCCDSSVNKHATKHFRASGHPIMASLEPGENWSWCYADDRFVPLKKHVRNAQPAEG